MPFMRRRTQPAGTWRGHPSWWTSPRSEHAVAGHVFELPGVYHRVECFGSLHLASYDAARDLLPSDYLRPARWFDGRAAVEVAVLRYADVTGRVDSRPTTLAPYAELSVSLLVARGRTAPRGLGVLEPSRFGVGGFVLDLPVTTAEACDLGRELYGFPKFVAGMEFREAWDQRHVRLLEDDREILTVDVRPGGPTVPVRRPRTLYSALDGELLETMVSVHGRLRRSLRPHRGRLGLGDHPVADRLRALEVEPSALAVGSWLDLTMMLPAGTPVGQAREWTGHRGERRDRGTFTVQYPDTPPLDQYEVPAGVLHA